MSVKKSQAILKRFIDLTFGIWFVLGSENELFSGRHACQGFQMTSSPVFLINLTYLRIPNNPNYHILIKKKLSNM